ncbi:acetate--CoA ligase family protein [Candidatus Bipolaricaulota bacterium]
MGWTYDQMQKLLEPNSIAVLGASEREGPGRQVIENSLILGFKGSIIPINPKYGSVLGLQCYPSLASAVNADRKVDAVAILLGRERVLPALEEAAAVGVKAAWAFASGFSESDSLGRTLQDDVADFCNEHGIAFCGPNCVGIVNPGAGTGLFSAPLPVDFPRGAISLVSQSGSICLALLNGARDVGFQTIVSSGNEAVLDSTDYLEYFVDDPDTRVLAAFIEQFRSPERFVAVAERAKNAGKPFVVLKVGRSEIARRATIAHTGALAGSDDVYEAMFRKHGVIGVRDLDELVQTVTAFSDSMGTYPEGSRVGMLTLSGGAISLAADVAEDCGLSFPKWSDSSKAAFGEVLPAYAAISNPLDAWGSGRIDETYEACIDIAAADDVDIVVLSQDAPAGISDKQRNQFAVVARAAGVARERTSKPIIALSHLSVGLDPELRSMFNTGGIPLLQGSRAGLKAVRHLATFGEGLQTTGSYRAPVDRSQVFSSPRAGVLDEIESKRIFTLAGIPCVEEFRCLSMEEAISAASSMGYPVVLKGVSLSVPHKSDQGLVILNVSDEVSVRESYNTLNDRMTRLSVYEPTIVVQRMVQGAQAEMLVGVSSDPAFGPYLVLGLGGKWVEVARERAIAIPPLQPHDVAEMLRDVHGGRLLESSRGLRESDIEALTDVLLRISDLALSIPSSLLALEINPLLILGEGRGVVAVDGLIEFAESCDQEREG